MTTFNALFVIGRSPAVLTETLAAAHARHGMVFARVRVVSTRAGAEGLRRALFDDGGWESFLREWPELACARFTARDIVAIDADDVRTADENRAMLDRLARELRDLTETDTPLLASLAGGRKTMGYYMGFMMGFFARPGDRLCHVLAPEEWERDPDFLVPPCDEAGRIDLVDVPFIRLRGHLGTALNNASAEALLASAQTAVDLSVRSPLTLRIQSRTLSFLGREITLSERLFAYMQFFAEEKLKRCRHPDRPMCEACTDCFLGYDEIDARKDDLLKIRSQFGGIHSGNYQRFEEAWDAPRAASANVPEPVRRLSEEIEQVFGADPRAEQAKIVNVGLRGHARYGLMADKSQIRLRKR